MNYVTNTRNRLDTREQIGVFQTELRNSDLVGLSFTDTFDRVVRPFAVAPETQIAIGAYHLDTLQLAYTGGQQRKISGSIVYEEGAFYGGSRRSLVVNGARAEVTPRVSLEPSIEVNRLRLPAGHLMLSVIRARATFTVTPRMFVSGIAQRNSATRSIGSNLRFRWEYQPGSELFIVYTDEYDSAASHGLSALRNRAFVVKLNRLFRP